VWTGPQGSGPGPVKTAEDRPGPACGQSRCHWVNIFKPLAYIVFHNPTLIQSLAWSSFSGGTDPSVIGDDKYAQWLCRFDKGDFLNLLNVLLHICEIRGLPISPLQPI